MNWHRIWNGDIVNLDHLANIQLHEYFGGGPCEIAGTFVGGQSVILAKCPNREAAEEALNRFMEEGNWNSLPEESLGVKSGD
jgi:hypothetical protein